MKTKCKRYAQAITDYVLGEEIDMPKEELMGHLKECAKCQQEATNWQDFQNALRVKEYHARPEVKEKWDRFISELTSPAPAKAPSDARADIDSATEKIYQCLKANDKIAIPVLRKETELMDYPFYEAMGVLITNRKVIVDKDKDNRPAYVSVQPGA